MRFALHPLVMVALAAAPAAAHIELEAPTPRSNDGQNKWCPCGGGGDGTRANAGCAVSESDPARGPSSGTFAPGAVVTVRWRETVGHTGRFRVSFDDDGADQSDFDANVLADIADPSGGAGNTGTGNLWSLDVTLPETPCDGCTLQLVQVMNGNPDDPVPSLFGTSTYYQCADLVIAAGGDESGSGNADNGGGDGGCAATPAALAPWAMVLLGARRRARHARRATTSSGVRADLFLR
ncbi:MAG: lytic polysaccharide monooxygenase [Deltaproteobacteria bacterium]|nr:lytic polysaccharide monooxygenase [Deltaproteobacteria bacterium]